MNFTICERIPFPVRSLKIFSAPKKKLCHEEKHELIYQVCEILWEALNTLQWWSNVEQSNIFEVPVVRRWESFTIDKKDA